LKTAEIISIGTELLLGEITDTNSSFLAGQLPALGLDLYWISQVGDNRARLLEVLQRAWGRSDLILLTGGLGPTEDDITREAIADLLGEELKVDPRLEQELRRYFASRNINMPERNLKQATLIPSAQAIPNPQGTAPGWWVEKEGRILLAMPGPPGELTRMWRQEVQPRLRARVEGAILVTRTLKSWGMTEAAVDERLSPLLSSSNPTLAVYAKVDGIYLRIAAKAATEEAARALILPVETEVRELLGEHIWGADDDSLEVIIGELLKEKGLTLATMESCTGGLVASTITDVPGSSNYFKGGVVAYSNEVKIAYGVPAHLIAEHGAVSPEVAQAMASAARLRLGADIGLGTTGVAGPDQIEGKTVGTVYIAVDNGQGIHTASGRYPPQRLRVKRAATTAALFELRRALLSRR